MKPLNQYLRTLKLTLCIFMVALPALVHAQLPDCSSGTVMYGIFNDSLGSGAASPSEIRSVNYATGAIGPLMGGVPYLIKTSSGTAFYGSAALAVDNITNRFYVMTQMSSGASRSKEIITINTVTATMIKIGTTPASVDFHHMVKMGIAPSGRGYAIGVGRDTAGAAATFNPLIRFTTCGAVPSTNCSTVELLGYLPVASGMTKWDLFNGDIAFDNAGNLYFATVSFGAVNSTNRYKDARLFKVLAADIPAVAGAGVIPMTLVADYNSLDSTVMNGIAFDPAGSMYFATRKFTGIQVSPYINQLYKSASPGSATLIPGLAPITAGYSIADLASCYFPLTILPNEMVELSAFNSGGEGQLKFKTSNNLDVIYYEVMRSTGNPENFEVIQRVQPTNDKAETSYSIKDANTSPGETYYYRIRSVMPDGKRLYSNVVKISFSNAIGIALKPWPNPFNNQVEFKLESKGPQTVTMRLVDEQGRMVKVQEKSLQRGVNRVVMDNLSQLKKGIYILEVAGATDKVIDKIMKF